MNRLVSEYVRLRAEAGALAPSLADEGTDVRSPTDLAERVGDLALQLADLGDRIESRSQELTRLNDNLQSVVEQGDSTTLLEASRADTESEVAALRRSAEELERHHRGESENDQALSRRLAEADQRRQELASLLILADRHLVENHCPVCGQSISLDEVKSSIAQRLDSLPGELTDLQREKNESESLIAGLEQERDALGARLRSAEERLADVDRQLRLRSATLRDFRTRLGQLGVDSQASGLRERLTSEHEAASNRARMAQALARECDAVGRRAAFLGARDRLSRLREQTEVRQQALNSILSEVHTLSSATELPGSVVVAARRAERDLVRSMLTSIEPVLDVLYGRLRPHPVLDRLRLDIGSFDEKGEVRFVGHSPSTEANVSTIIVS
jgi:chromosome segregation ATPase